MQVEKPNCFPVHPLLLCPASGLNSAACVSSIDYKCFMVLCDEQLVKKTRGCILLLTLFGAKILIANYVMKSFKCRLNKELR